ncbi:hypothetical protein [Couchioplanes caeruleus]|uniref:Uncharacterized protein n=1 Tax=Couchioplanes caeruleus subsp. caeruleus TaxID=56427 RepID=A0A1K0FTS2_9ACTN|nr:hypothetical protein [Couchioplanes caeruleus]OJF16064.1 hypothetical protein BG844_00895 [Couchioplanes caeruleus subsp. caeruleus]
MVFIGKPERLTGAGIKGRLGAAFFRAIEIVPVERDGATTMPRIARFSMRFRAPMTFTGAESDPKRRRGASCFSTTPK